MRDDLERAHAAEHAAVNEARGREDDACGECGGRGWVADLTRRGRPGSMPTAPCPRCSRLDSVTRHTKTWHPSGPDFCAECSAAIQEWVTWAECQDRRAAEGMPRGLR